MPLFCVLIFCLFVVGGLVMGFAESWADVAEDRGRLEPTFRVTPVAPAPAAAQPTVSPG